MNKITEIFAWVIEDNDGNEAIPAVTGPNGMILPLMGADLARAKTYTRYAQAQANDKGKTVKLIKSTALEVVSTLDPEKK